MSTDVAADTKEITKSSLWLILCIGLKKKPVKSLFRTLPDETPPPCPTQSRRPSRIILGWGLSADGGLNFTQRALWTGNYWWPSCGSQDKRNLNMARIILRMCLVIQCVPVFRLNINSKLFLSQHCIFMPLISNKESIFGVRNVSSELTWADSWHFFVRDKEFFCCTFLLQPLIDL